MLLLFMVLIFVANVAEAADSITPDKSTISLNEGSNTTLTCTYEGSPDSLHWYRQKPGSKPEFLLLIIEGTETVVNAQPPHPRLNITRYKDDGKKKVNLKLFFAVPTDSALYYCALTTGSAFNKIVFGKGMMLTVETKVTQEPVYYKMGSSGNNEYCLATGFTVPNATDDIPSKQNTEAVRFPEESYYSKVFENITCEESGTCKNTESKGFSSDVKTKFVSVSIFWLRILFLKTILFNVLMTVKLWMS